MKVDYQIQILERPFVAIGNAKIWYNSQSEGLGEIFALEIKTGIGVNKKFPLLFPLSHSNYRKYVCGRFPFRIFYKVNKRKHLIIIVGVLHDKQSFKSLTTRKQK